MDKLINLYQELAEKGIRLFTWDIASEKASTLEVNGQYAIFMDFDNIATRSEETVVLAHEGGHCSTGALHRACSPYDLIEKHEYKAWKWAVQTLVSAEELDEAIAQGYTSAWSLAEYFNVTEDFMRKVLCWYIHGNLDVREYMCP